MERNKRRALKHNELAAISIEEAENALAMENIRY